MTDPKPAPTPAMQAITTMSNASAEAMGQAKAIVFNASSCGDLPYRALAKFVVQVMTPDRHQELIFRMHAAVYASTKEPVPTPGHIEALMKAIHEEGVPHNYLSRFSNVCGELVCKVGMDTMNQAAMRASICANLLGGFFQVHLTEV